MKTIEDLIKLAKKKDKKRLVVACGDDSHVLLAVEHARKIGLIEVILVGDVKKTEAIALSNHIDLSFYKLIDEPDRMTAALLSASLIYHKEADILMKGFIDTKLVLKAVLNKTYPLIGNKRLSHMSLIDSTYYHKLFMLTDAAMNIDYSLPVKVDLINNGVEVLLKLGVFYPKVAVLAAVEKINPKMQATLDAEALVALNRGGDIKNCLVDGPFQLDNAINEAAAVHKNIASEVAGNADLLLLPSIEAANIFYKSLMFLSGAKSASIITGAAVPIIVTSRADSHETKFNSIALGVLLS